MHRFGSSPRQEDKAQRQTKQNTLPTTTIRFLMSSDTQTPILVGVGQVLNRITDLAEAVEPLQMMMQASRLAEEDAECGHFLDQVQSVRVIRGMWNYENPARWLGDQFGARNFETVGTLIGGNQNQAVINETACEIRDGKLELVLITGAEDGNAQTKARKLGVDLPQTKAPGMVDRMIGAEQQPEHHPLRSSERHKSSDSSLSDVRQRNSPH